MIVLPDIGLLMSCSYDKSLIVWKYHEEKEVARLERGEELRCMDYLKSIKTLFVGTNDKNILTIPLEDILQGTAESKYVGKDDTSYLFNQTGQSFNQKMGMGGADQFLEESGDIEEDFEKMLKNKQALLVKLQLDDDDPLKKLMSNQDQIVKQH
jgi:hypothetical protein